MSLDEYLTKQTKTLFLAILPLLLVGLVQLVGVYWQQQNIEEKMKKLNDSYVTNETLMHYIELQDQRFKYMIKNQEQIRKDVNKNEDNIKDLRITLGEHPQNK